MLEEKTPSMSHMYHVCNKPFHITVYRLAGEADGGLNGNIFEGVKAEARIDDLESAVGVARVMSQHGPLVR